MPTDPDDELGIDHEHLRRVVHRRVFGDSDPVRIGRYTVLERIGSGAMGVVYAAYDNDLDRKVAVKVLRTGGSGTRRRLLREAQALARVSHPAVCQIYEVGEQDGEVFLAMELVPGITMRDWLQVEPRTAERIVALFVEAARGVAAAHDKGVVHRDIKPDNIIVGEDGHARVVDFGLAIGVDTEVPRPGKAALADDGLTQTGTTLGTPAYMAPEQLGGGSAHPLADQFALCLSLYEALSGMRPFEGMSLQERRSSDVLEAIRWPKTARMSPRIQRAVLQGLAADPGARHESLSALADALEGPSGKRRWALGGLAVAGMTAALLVGAKLGAGLGPAPEPSEPSRAVGESEGPSDLDARLIVAEARNLLRGDPTATWRHLAKLPDDPAHWTEEVAGLADFAYGSGVARTRRLLEDHWVTTVGDGVLELDREMCELRHIGVDGALRFRVDGQCRGDELRAPLDVGSGRALLERNGELVWTDFDSVRVLSRFENGWSASLGRDGSVVLAAGPEVTIWDPAAGNPQTFDLVKALADDPDGVSRVRAARFSPDPQVIDVLYDDALGGARTAMLDVRSKTVHAFGWGIVAAKALGPGQAIVQKRDGRLHRWTREQGTRSLDPSAVRLGAFEPSVDQTWLAAVTEDDEIVTWELETGRRRQIEIPHFPRTLMSAEGPFVAVGVEEAVYVVTRTGQVVRKVQHGARVMAMRWIDGSTLETRSSKSVRTWAIPNVPVLGGHAGGVEHLAFVGSDRLLSSGLSDREIRLWNLQTGASEVIREGPADAVRGFDVSPDGRFVLVDSSGDGTFVLDVDSRDRLEPPQRLRRGFFWSDRAIVYTPRVLVLDPETGKPEGVTGVREYDVELGTMRQVVDDAQSCTVMDATHYGEVATKCEDGRFRIWGRDGTLRWEWVPSESHLELDELPGMLDVFRVGPRGRYVWKGVLWMDRRSVVVDRVTGAEAVVEPLAPDFSFHPTAPSLVGRQGHRLMVTSLATGNSRIPVLAFDDDVETVTLSPDGTRLAYGTERGEIRVRDQPLPTDPEALRDFVRANQPTIEP